MVNVQRDAYQASLYSNIWRRDTRAHTAVAPSELPAARRACRTARARWRLLLRHPALMILSPGTAKGVRNRTQHGAKKPWCIIHRSLPAADNDFRLIRLTPGNRPAEVGAPNAAYLSTDLTLSLRPPLHSGDLAVALIAQWLGLKTPTHYDKLPRTLNPRGGLFPANRDDTENLPDETAPRGSPSSSAPTDRKQASTIVSVGLLLVPFQPD